MIKYSFKNDYSEGAHERILSALSRTNFTQEEGYGDDQYSIEAKKLFKELIEHPKADIHFISGGTQANLVFISSVLRPHESVIAAETGHIAVHETGAIEATGHKINTVVTPKGKLSVANIKEVLDAHTDEHMVKPKLVFISNSTEVGSIYTLDELQTISVFCRNNNLFLYLDGARIGSALSSEKNDMDLTDIAKLVDAFYIGGTKNGALFGEALILINDYFKDDFRYFLKQKGALLAKGRVLGTQFLELFKDGLYFQLATHANTMAFKLAKAFIKEGYEMLSEPESNQIFPILENYQIKILSEKYNFYTWEKIDESKSAIRLVCSWATNEQYVDQFIDDLKNLK